jgi:serine/threonine protein kinase
MLVNRDKSSRLTILREAKIVREMMECGGNEHVISILGHGWLKGPDPGRYFIDMQLADSTLEKYIQYLFAASDTHSHGLDKIFDTGDLSRDRGSIQKMVHFWTIGRDIARGLEFLHENEAIERYAHRDLKPSNGTTSFL